MLNSALNTVFDEHRSLAAVVRGLRHLSERYSREDAIPDFALLRAILDYLDEFPNNRHHPKEEAYLFSRLLARTDSANDVISTLMMQHAEEACHLRALCSAVNSLEADRSAAEGFSAAVAAYSGHVLRHMALEESELIPLALAHLTAEDWVAIGTAFGENGDPRFTEDPAQGYRDLFGRLVNLTLPNTGSGIDELR